MPSVNPDHWASLHLRWRALSRWDNEGGASPLRPVEGDAVPPPPQRAAIRPWLDLGWHGRVPLTAKAPTTGTPTPGAHKR